MPYLHLHTNRKLSAAAGSAFLESAINDIARTLNMAPDSVMCCISDDTKMRFAGSSDAVAYIDVKAIDLPVEKVPDIVNGLVPVCVEFLGVKADRCFIRCESEAPGYWAWGQRVF